MHYPVAVPTCVALAGLMMTWWFISHVTNDHVCVKLALWSYVLKIFLAGFLFYLSLTHGATLAKYGAAEGFWVFAEDAVGYHNLAYKLLQAWKGVEPFPHLDRDSWPFIIYMATIYRFLGVHWLNASFLNAWYGTLIVSAGLAIMQRWGLSMPSIRIGVALLAFWPSLLLWSSQPVKDSMILALIMLGLYCLVRLVTYPHRGPSLTLIVLAGSLGLLLIPLKFLRQYSAIALAATTMIAILLLTIQAWRRKAYRRIVTLLAIALYVSLAIRATPDINPLTLLGPVQEPKWVGPLPAVPPAPSQSAVAAKQGVSVHPAQVSSVKTITAMNSQLEMEDVADESLDRTLARHVSHGLTLTPYLSPKAIYGFREGFVSTGGHSLIDSEITLDTLPKVLAYIPRGLSIALLAPFPWQWFDTGGRTGVFRPFSTVEVILVYLVMAAWLLRAHEFCRYWTLQTVVVIIFVLLMAVPMSLTVANLGTLFRLRLQFILPLIVLLCVVDLSVIYRCWIDGVRTWIVAREKIWFRKLLS